jgi:hypothetical protein
MATITAFHEVNPSSSTLNDMSQLAKKEKDALLREVEAYVENYIEAKIDTFQPHGWRKVTYFLREWGLAGTNITVIVALLALAATAFYQANARVTEQTKFEDKTAEALDKINEHLQRIDTALSTSQIQQAAINPIDKSSALEAKNALDYARKNHVELTADIVEQTGKRFIEAADKSPTAWDATLGFLNYKSFIYKLPSNVPSVAGASTNTTYHVTTPPRGLAAPQFMVAKIVPIASAAEFDYIGRDQNLGKTYGDGYIFAVGGVAIIALVSG